jgi:hypothetical protein
MEGVDDLYEQSEGGDGGEGFLQQSGDVPQMQALVPVTARKDDAPAAHQAALTEVAGRGLFSEGGGLIHTTSG